ncbi:TMEM175 family protein [Sphingomonas kyeonggiensis]|uniref:Putative membrane protein n=1 Tax=Sphingomonas kyeonggiensis TaxID=1268553 RepID=A0A7W6JRC7_9SPHN|nr:TMEM175 family protein [Sphingomonas kyeonggiensis]MBB4097085.1 putative membrane protein [Sphingomonas kyeonggiensis]
MSETEEGRGGVNRVEAFSDGVIAIIITIMVLEMKAPEEHGLEHLWAMWPIFIAYVLSYAYVAIYWVNHHRLFAHAARISNALLWANIALLFTLSLVPFATAYLGEQHFSHDATLVYMCVMMLPSFAYVWLQSVIRRTGRQDAAAQDYHQHSLRKGMVASAIYASGIALTFVSPWAGLACAALVAILWFLPKGPIDALFGG